MSFIWLDYLVLAEALPQARTSLAPEEACCLAAISRAYPYNADFGYIFSQN